MTDAVKAMAEALEQSITAHIATIRAWMYAPFPAEAQVLGGMSPPQGPFNEGAVAVNKAKAALAAFSASDTGGEPDLSLLLWRVITEELVEQGCFTFWPEMEFPYLEGELDREKLCAKIMAALSTSSPIQEEKADLAFNLRDWVKRLANTSMNLSLTDWSFLSNDMLAAAEALSSAGQEQGGSDVPPALAAERLFRAIRELILEDVQGVESGLWNAENGGYRVAHVITGALKPGNHLAPYVAALSPTPIRATGEGPTNDPFHVHGDVEGPRSVERPLLDLSIQVYRERMDVDCKQYNPKIAADWVTSREAYQRLITELQRVVDAGPKNCPFSPLRGEGSQNNSGLPPIAPEETAVKS